MGIEHVMVTSLLYMACKKFLLPKAKFQGALVVFLIYSYYLVSSQVAHQGLNVYQQLQISRSLTTKEINQSYKRELIHKHPDKSKSPNAEKEFREMKELYDHIKNSENRKNYERFGTKPKSEVILHAAGFYISWIFVANGIYFSKISNSGRNLLCLVSIIGILDALIFPLILDYEIYFVSFTVFEVSQILKALAPAVCFMMNCLEHLRIQHLEECREKSYNQIVNETGKEFISALMQRDLTQEPGEVDKFVKRMKEEFRMKYETSWKNDLIPVLIIFYLITR
jgi:curved DNA-binding protein CbpA